MTEKKKIAYCLNFRVQKICNKNTFDFLLTEYNKLDGKIMF